MIELSPLEDGQDDWPRLKEMMDICAYKETICLESGKWICRSKQRIPSGTHLVASPGVKVHQELVYTGTDFLNAAFSSGPVFGDPITGTLSASIPVSSNQVTSYALFPVGSIVRLSRGASGLCQLYYRIVSASSSMPYTYTLSRPVKHAFFAGDMIQSVESIPTDIRIDGNGMSVSGTGDRYFEIAAGLRCQVSGVRIDPSHGWLGVGGPAMSFDIGGYLCSFTNCVINSVGQEINAGAIIESGERCTIQGCTAEYTGRVGVGLYDCVSSYLVDCVSTGCTYGAYIGSDGIMVGCRDCGVRGGTFWNNQQGVLCGVSQRSIISGLTCNYNTQCGIKIATNEVDSIVSDCCGVGNALKFLEVQPDCRISVNNIRS